MKRRNAPVMVCALALVMAMACLTGCGSATVLFDSINTIVNPPLPGGTLDTTFGTGGKVTTGIVAGYFDYAQGAAVQSDGKIVVAGHTSLGGGTADFAVVRYTAAGNLDTTFSGDGKATTDVLGNDDKGNSVAIRNYGGEEKIVIAGSAYNGSNDDFAVVRYNADGSLDTTFSGDGKLNTAIGTGPDTGFAVAIQTDGKIVVAGFSSNGSNADFAVVRYNADGSLDTSFSGDGKVMTAVGLGDDMGLSVAIQTDGKIVVGGSSFNGSNADFAVVRYNSDGSLDTSFDGDGKVTTPIGTADDWGYSIALQSDGKIVVAGYYYVSTNTDVAVVRYTAAGALDASFGTGGVVKTSIVSPNSDWGRAIAIQTDDKIVVAGYADNGGPNDDFAAVRYTTAGMLDADFGTGGILTTPIGTLNATDQGYSIALQSDGKIVVAGHSYIGTDDEFAVVRYWPGIIW